MKLLKYLYFIVAFKVFVLFTNKYLNAKFIDYLLFTDEVVLGLKYIVSS